MKTVCIAVLVCCAVALAQPKPPHAMFQESGCLQKMGISMEEVRDFMEKDDSESAKKLGCFEACVMKYTHLMNDDGTIEASKVHEHIDGFGRMPEDLKADMHSKVDGCVAEAEKLGDECEKAQSFRKCAFPKPPHGRHPPRD